MERCLNEFYKTHQPQRYRNFNPQPRTLLKSKLKLKNRFLKTNCELLKKQTHSSTNWQHATNEQIRYSNAFMKHINLKHRNLNPQPRKRLISKMKFETDALERIGDTQPTNKIKHINLKGIATSTLNPKRI